MTKRNRPLDITVLSLLFMLGAVVSAICCAGLLVPVDEPHPYLRLLPALVIMGTEAVSWLVLVGIACVVAALGLWRCAYWGFLTATVALVLFLAARFVRALFTNRWWELLLILSIGALIMWYLRRREPFFGHRTAER
jgi:hypothetical protein